MDKINYDKLMQEEISTFNGTKKSILLHSCCGPCSSACIERLKEHFDITIIYYNPNIEPYEEYLHRKNEQIRLLNELNIKYIDDDYNNDYYHKLTEPLNNEKEGGKRCAVCFGIRLKYTAKKALDLGYDYFATTLTVSPHKNSDIINNIGYRIGKEYGIKFLYSDFKKREGYKRSIELSKKYDLYRQNYCGCLYSKEINNEE
ncbi:MAG TPA: epoxyqueuosine reductase QueH [Bacilli bacterium]|jgi:predicted adenine nucleotide alpha hydrolase (AANH) superfamily ATPase|nr:epoxyqueuosine reductase QueH [Bacilli bacterium]